jgi:hypothetical protein
MSIVRSIVPGAATTIMATCTAIRVARTSIAGGMAITSIVACIGPTDTGELSDGRRGPQSPLQRRSITPLYGERG